MYDIHRILRITFAINRVWEPDWKRLSTIMKNLELKPERLAERVDAIFSTSELRVARWECNQLILEVLDLTQPIRDVSRARALIQKRFHG